MSRVITKLTSRYSEFSGIDFSLSDEAFSIHDLNKQLNETIAAADTELDKKLLYDYPMIVLEYSVICQQLTAHLNLFSNLSDLELNDTNHREDIKEQLISAFVLSNLLKYIDKNFLRRNIATLTNQQDRYTCLLSSPTLDDKLRKSRVAKLSWGRGIRSATIYLTWWRLFIARSRRLLEVIALMGTGWELFQDFGALLMKFGAPVIAYISWIFFIPRLIDNFISVGVHSVPLFSSRFYRMTEQEKELGSWVCFRTQMVQRWPELANDIPWFIVGLLNCFVLVGALAPFAPTLTVCFYGYDVLIACIRTFVELGRLNRLKKSYEADDEDPASLDFLSHLNHRIKSESLRLGILITSTVLIVTGGLGALSILANLPYVPLVGAVILVLVSLTLFITDRLIPKYRRPNNPEEVPNIKNLASRLGFFAPTSMQESKTSSYIFDPPTPESSNRNLAMFYPCNA